MSGFSTLDELPEAIELPGRHFVLGVQWHPEADPRSAVVAGFVEACREAVLAADGEPVDGLRRDVAAGAAGTRPLQLAEADDGA